MSRRHHKHNLSTAGLLILPPSWLHVQLSPSWSEVKVAQSCPHGLYSPWNSPGQNTGVGSLSLLQGIFPTQGLNPGLWHCRQILYQLSHKGSPRILEWVVYPVSRGSSWPRNWTGVSCIAGRFFINWAIRETHSPSWLMTTPSFQFLGQKPRLPPCCLTFSNSSHLTCQSFTLKIYAGDFPCGPVAETPHSQWRGPGFDPCSGN